VRQTLSVSERRACRTLGQHRSTQRKIPRGRDDEGRLTADIIELARSHGRYGYRRVTSMLGDAGWHVNHKRVERIWKREGLKVPQKQPKRARLWLNDGSCVRLRPERPNHVWSYDFVQDRTHDGRACRTLNIIDEFTKEALMIRVNRRLNSIDVVDALTDLFILRGPPEFSRSDNGPEFVAEKARSWITAVGARTAYIEPGSPRENGYGESFNARCRDELLNGEIKDRDRAVAPALQYHPPAQRTGLETSSPGNHRPDGPKAGHALTIKSDHSVGADQSCFAPSGNRGSIWRFDPNEHLSACAQTLRMLLQAIGSPLERAARLNLGARHKELSMTQTITKSSKAIVTAALAQVPAISAEKALPLIDSPDHVFVDLRDGTEQEKTGVIPGAVASSRGMMEFHIDPDSPVHKPEFNQDKTYVFYCASGGRSALAALAAMEMGLKPVVNLSGGVAAWKKAGGTLDRT
jgi:rhodanese-related sulfurtransferase/transposase InsO family protein